MKRLLFSLCLLTLLLCGCTAQTPAGSSDSVPPAASVAPAAVVDEQQLLVGVWRNEGQYTEGREFVETMTLDSGGICTVTLEYQGAPYETLEGVYMVSNGTLTVTFENASGFYDRIYRYTLDGDTLTLQNGQKEVTYLRLA